jgi:quercetin dioxygenase-like cupin family protein
MRTYSLAKMTGGWFVGDFSPTVLRTGDFEVAIKEYAAGAREPKHHHKIAEEITVVVTGRARMCGQIVEGGTVVHLEPGESTDFEALDATLTVVVKRPSVHGDKYLD